MKFIERLTDLIIDNELSLNIYRNKISITNYIEIPHFDSNKIVVKHKGGIVVITGYKLVVTKLLINELLVSGEIKTIELG
jgi:hypothetical protein